MKFDFGGYATRNNLKCTDGRVIRKDAFKDNHMKTVPLVWQHMSDIPDNFIGHAMLENREDGVYAFCSFNNSENAQKAKELVRHGDIKSLSIFANKLVEKGKEVVHGCIREVSLVMVGANPGAYIDNIVISHGDGSTVTSAEEAIMFFETPIDTDVEHADKEGESKDKTMQEVYDTLNEDQKNLVHAMIAAAIADDDSDDPDEGIDHSDEGGKHVKKNIFEKHGSEEGATLTHADFLNIVENAKKSGSFKEAFLAHAETNGTPGVDYGIKDIELLFPDYRNVRDTPDFIKRDDAWVAGVIAGTNKTPFARIRTMTVDITEDIARARGYKKGTLKKEEVIKMAKRTTDPATIYKKQKLDRDDILDITSFDVVTWLKAEMQMMLREELARAILIGDGREALSEDKIDETKIRPIYKEEELYAYHVEVEIRGETENEKYLNLINDIAEAMIDYKGSGAPTLYTTKKHHFKMKKVVDKIGRRLYNTDAELADALGVSAIVDVPVMEGVKDSNKDLIALIVNLKDYTIGTNRGGQTTFFDDFDIDYNQYKYLYETRLSGALTRPDSAVIIEMNDASSLSLTSASRLSSTVTSGSKRVSE